MYENGGGGYGYVGALRRCYAGRERENFTIFKTVNLETARKWVESNVKTRFDLFGPYIRVGIRKAIVIVERHEKFIMCFVCGMFSHYEILGETFHFVVYCFGICVFVLFQSF